jgi:hypothetical protein
VTPIGGKTATRGLAMKTLRIVGVLLVAWGISVSQDARAASDYEFYFFGINVGELRDADPVMLAAGAIASIAVHELGHALYLQSQGKRWSLEGGPTSGIAIQTSDALSGDQMKAFGRAGFLLQTAVGTVLTSLGATRHSDFTKGFVALNAFQIWSYDARGRSAGDDFDMIQRGQGNSDIDRSLFSAISLYNMRVFQDTVPLYPFFAPSDRPPVDGPAALFGETATGPGPRGPLHFNAQF